MSHYHSTGAKRTAERCNYRHRKRVDGYSDIKPSYLLGLRESSKTCPVCGCRMVDPRSAGEHPRAKTLDHIIPLSAGGTHTKDNIRYVCNTCNQGLNQAWLAIQCGREPDPVYGAAYA